MNKTYFYNAQFKEYIKQFLRVFANFEVELGVDRDNDNKLDRRTCPVYYGGMDRVVANVLHKEGVSYTTTLPIMSGNLVAIELNPENRRTNYHEENISRVRGSDGVPIIDRKKIGVPYRLSMDLSIYTSNMDQMFQLIEQILMMFNPKIVIQRSDDIRDFTYITEIELLSISNEQNVPAATDERMIVNTLSFIFDVWLNYPFKETEAVVQTITTTIRDNTYDSAGADLEGFNVDQNTNPKVL